MQKERTAESASVRSAVLVSVFDPRNANQARSSQAELRALSRGLGIDFVDDIVQHRESPDSFTYLGKGRLRELHALLEQQEQLVVVVDDELTPSQKRALQGSRGSEVWDRLDVVLQTFEARATSPLARVEVGIARLKTELPRVRDDESLGDKEGGGGRGGRGHSNVELTKQRLRKKLAELERRREELVARGKPRSSDGPPRVAFVGYTNAGKSTWVRRLTGANIFVEDQLFATLDTTARLLSGFQPRTLAVDTVGFIQNLPHNLVGSFRATLEEAEGASLLIVVLDAADPHLEQHLATIEGTLAETTLATSPGLFLLNKWDQASSDQRALARRLVAQGHPVCAFDPDAGEVVRGLISERLHASYLRRSFYLAWEDLPALARNRENLVVLKEDHHEDGVRVVVEGSAEAIERLRRDMDG